MRFRASAILLFISIFAAVPCWADGQLGASASTTALLQISDRSIAPAFSEKDIFEKAVITLNSYRGEVVVLSFWATWSAASRDQISAFESLQALHQGKIVVIGASVYSNSRNTEQLYREDEVNYPMLYGSYELMAEYGNVSTIPTTFLIDKQGRIAATIIGSRTAGQYEAMLKSLLSEQWPSAGQ